MCVRTRLCLASRSCRCDSGHLHHAGLFKEAPPPVRASRRERYPWPALSPSEASWRGSRSVPEMCRSIRTLGSTRVPSDGQTLGLHPRDACSIHVTRSTRSSGRSGSSLPSWKWGFEYPRSLRRHTQTLSSVRPRPSTRPIIAPGEGRLRVVALSPCLSGPPRLQPSRASVRFRLGSPMRVWPNWMGTGLLCRPKLVRIQSRALGL